MPHVAIKKSNISDHQKSYLTDNHGNEGGRKLLKKKKMMLVDKIKEVEKVPRGFPRS